MTKSSESRAYFRSWSWNHLPLRPREPISKEEAEQGRAYYVGYHNQANQLIRFEKYLDGTPDWKVEYVYWDNGKVKERSITKPDGSRSSEAFDRKGKRIQS